MVKTIVGGFVLVLAGCAATPPPYADVVDTEVLARHDYMLATSPNKRTALAYLYTAWNDGQLAKARLTYWVRGSFPQLEKDGVSTDLPSGIGTTRYTIKKVIEEGDQVVVLAFVEGVGIGKEFTTVFGTPGGVKIGDAVVEIFQFAPNGLIMKKWDTIEPLSDKSYDFR